MLLLKEFQQEWEVYYTFQWAPTLGGECYYPRKAFGIWYYAFQWAPTLGGECYAAAARRWRDGDSWFQWAPTLGGECYRVVRGAPHRRDGRFNGHPPLGVNATV